MKLLNFGSCNIDYVYNVDHIVVPGETQEGGKLDIFPGGKGLNQSIAAAKAGVETYHAGCIGEDGGMLERVMQEGGVNTRFLRSVEGKSGHAIIQLSKRGENSIILYRGANGALTEEYIDGVLENFEAGDFLLLQNEVNNVEYMIDRASEKGMQIVFNPAPFTESLKNIDYGKISYLILNEIEAQGVGGKQTPEENLAEIKALFPSLKIVMTLGGNGCVYADSVQQIPHPAFQVSVADTTAAGDTFIGYFIAEVAKEKSCATAIKTASAASALAVSKKGAAISIPLYDDVIEALKELKPICRTRGEADKQKACIEQYFQEHIADAKLRGLASALGYSETYTGEVVKKLTGVTFSDLLQEKRCALACKLLTETDLPVEEIISQVGYENESFFRSVFKKKYGKSPCRYRKEKM